MAFFLRKIKKNYFKFIIFRKLYVKRKIISEFACIIMI